QILIITPFRNEDHAIPQYIESLRAVDYPKDLIDVWWLENDSSDNTLQMLKSDKAKLKFRSVRLDSVRIIGPVKKQRPGIHAKDIGYGEHRVKSWLVIWNKYFLPFIRKSGADYVLMWYADSVVQPNVIKEYLKVFEMHKDAGWVGGAIYFRYPKHEILASPIPLGEAKPRLPCAPEYQNPVEVKYIGHVWMCQRAPLASCTFARIGRDMHISLILCLKKQHRLRVYYQPTVFIKHIATDGKIYAHKLSKEAMKMP
ncbi:unnamed protein product, partial [marine sediment metagenome]